MIDPGAQMKSTGHSGFEISSQIKNFDFLNTKANFQKKTTELFLAPSQ